MVPPSRQRAGSRGAAVVALAVLLVGLPAAGRAEGSFDARVVAVRDGDSLEVLRSTAGPDSPVERVRVRLQGIDAPERGQPWSRRARGALAARVEGRVVRIHAVTIDRYGRTVGEVQVDGVCVACELVRDGHAWVYRRYSHDPALLRLEAEARAAGRGLWGLPAAGRVPPWEWRAGRRQPAQQRPDAQAGRDRAPGPEAAPGGPPGAPFRCGERHTCAEMRSCAEARFHLEHCGLTRIDGDGDGVPCEALCR